MTLRLQIQIGPALEHAAIQVDREAVVPGVQHCFDVLAFEPLAQVIG